MSTGATPTVRLGHVARNGISPSMYGLVERGTAKRPEIATSLRGRVELRFQEGFAPVRLEFRGREVVVEDGDGSDSEWHPDVVIRGSLPDISRLAVTPLIGGVPNPVARSGRAALASVAARQVRIDGSRPLARRVLQLLRV